MDTNTIDPFCLSSKSCMCCELECQTAVNIVGIIVVVVAIDVCVCVCVCVGVPD